MDHIQKEGENEDEMPEQISKARASRRSDGEQPRFSDFNPFQSGSEEAAERERRRRKVRSLYSLLPRSTLKRVRN